jgi:hypothetical protein
MEDPSSKGVIGEHAVESISCSTRSRAWMHVIGTSPDQASSRRSSLGSLNSTQKQRRQWRNGRRIAQSIRKTTSRPIRSPSLNSAFYSYPGTRNTAGRPALPTSTGGMPHPAVRAGIPHLVEHSNRPLVGLMLPIRATPAGSRQRKDERADVTTDGQVSLSNGTLQRKRTPQRA